MTLETELVTRIDAYWRAANYLSVGQIYLFDNPLLKQPLAREHVKPRLLGHWGTTPGLNFIYAHLNRVIRQYDLDVLYVTGPGHGGPGLVANAYLEGTYSELYPDISQDEGGMKRLFKQFSFPGGIPSHVAPETPGSIHEGGELGYALSHAYGAAFDNPNLIVACVVGDGEAETGPLATSWHSNKFLDPVRDGAVLPILHLNGYKIAGPTVLARIPRAELEALLPGYGYAPYFVEGNDPTTMHQQMAETLERAMLEIRSIQSAARATKSAARPRWPMIVLRTPKGWTGPKEVDGKPVEGTFRAHQVPIADVKSAEHLRLLETWMRSYQPQQLFDANGTLRAELAALAPSGDAAHERQPARQRWRAPARSAAPRFSRLRRRRPAAGHRGRRSHARAGRLHPRRHEAQHRQLPRRLPRRDRLEPLECGLRGHQPRLDGRDPPRRRSRRHRRARHGDAERAPVPGLARGLPADRPPRLLLLLRGVHPHRRLDVQPARQVAQGDARDPVAAADRVAQLPAHLARLAAGSQRLQPPGSRLHRSRRQQEGRGHPRLPAAGRQHAPVGHRPLPAQPQLRQRDRRRQVSPSCSGSTMEQAAAHCSMGLSIWEWASSDAGGEPDVVMACAGDVPTLETLAAVDLLRTLAPELRVRVINVVDLMRLQPPSEHPHGLPDEDFDALFTVDKPIIFAFHGYPWLIHRLTYRRRNHDNLHVRGYKEEGSTTTPFDMTVRNDLDRFHLIKDVAERVPKLAPRAAHVAQAMQEKLMQHHDYICKHGEDMPEVKGWRWNATR